MICTVCRQTETVNGLTTVRFERVEMRYVILNVPAHVCPNCDEAYVEEDVARRLLEDAGHMSRAGILDDVWEYK